MDTIAKSTDKMKELIFIKVPQILLVFWIVKLLTTGMGEAFADYLQFTIMRNNPSMAGTIEGIVVLALAATLLL
jgi:uncharacterized membrane-anchored protein